MVKRVLGAFLLVVFLSVIPCVIATDTTVTVNIGKYYKTYISVLRDTDDFQKITSFFDWPNYQNLLVRNFSTSEDMVQIGIAVKSSDDTTLLNERYGPFDVTKPILIDIRADLGINNTNITNTNNITVRDSSSNNTNATNNQTNSSNSSTNETIIINTTTTATENSENDTAGNGKEITGWVLIFKTKDNKIRLAYPIVAGVFVAFLVILFIFRKFKKSRKHEEDGDYKVKKYSEMINEGELLEAEKKIKEAQEDIEKLKTRQVKLKEAKEKFDKAKDEWEHAREELD